MLDIEADGYAEDRTETHQGRIGESRRGGAHDADGRESVKCTELEPFGADILRRLAAGQRNGDEAQAVENRREHEEPVAGWIGQKQQKLPGAERALVDHHIEGQHATFAFARRRPRKPAFRDHEDQRGAETVYEPKRYPGVWLDQRRQDQAGDRQQGGKSRETADVTGLGDDALAVQASDDESQGMEGQDDTDDGRIEILDRHAQRRQRAEQAVAQEQSAHAGHQGAEGDYFLHGSAL